MMRRRVRWFLLTSLGLWVGLSLILVQSQDRITDATITHLFGRVHNVMKEQQKRLNALLDAFLLGDEKAIERYADQIGQDMVRISATFPPKPGKEVEQWKALAEILERSRQLKDSARRQRYQQAYRHFTALVNQCMMCHQVRRTKGVFPEPPGDEPSPPATETEAPPSPRRGRIQEGRLNEL